jgi:SAM-dependent methyltransferase
MVPTSGLAAEYDSQYLAWVRRQGPQALDLQWRVEHLLWRQRVLLRRYPPRGKHVLDYGCMDGIFTIRLQQLGGEAHGYDISPAAIAQAERFRGESPGPRFSTIPPPPQQFDIVYCNEVLEHIPDDRAFIGQVIRFLVPGGVLVGTVPMGRAFWDPDHKRAYDEASLHRALAPWGAVAIRRYYRSWLRNLLPLNRRGAAVFLFEVRPPSLPDAR